MGNNVVIIPCRISSRMLRAIDAFSAKSGGDRNDVIQAMVNRFIMSPVYLAPIDVLELREPVEHLLSVNLEPNAGNALKEMAAAQQVSVSALLRNALYCGLREGDA